MPATSWLLEEGKVLSPALLPVTDRGCRHGMALFETLRNTPDGLWHIDAHLALLQCSCDEAGFPPVADALRSVRRLLEGEVRREDGMVRVYVTAGDGAPGAPIVAPRVFILAESQCPLLGCRKLWIMDEPHVPAPHGWKTASYWPNLRALHAAQAHGAQEALLFDVAGRLISAATANVFLVIDAELWTPSAEMGARRGVVRDFVCSSFPVRVAEIFREQIERADEIFLTSSGVGVCRAYYGKLPASTPVTDRVATCFEASRK